MIAMIEHLGLFASNVGRAFQQHTERGSSNSGSFVLILLGIAAIVAAAVGAMYLLERRKAVRAVQVDSEQLLFRELCRIHGLNDQQSQLLLALSESLGAGRCEIFVDPAILDGAIAAGHAKSYASLRTRLFGDDGDADDMG